MKATQKTSSGEDLRSIQTEEALLEIARDEISLSERIICEWIASQERIAIAAIESQERLELARLGSDEETDSEELGESGGTTFTDHFLEVLPTMLPLIMEAFSPYLGGKAEEVRRAANG